MKGKENLKRKTISEELVTLINVNVFFKEFTFSKNEFYPQRGEQKELADNIIIIDDLLFVIQIKERDCDNATTNNVDNWFLNKVRKKAKDQIKNTIRYFNKYEEIIVENEKKERIDVSKANLSTVNKLVVYKCDEKLNKENRECKFFDSNEVGVIHVLNYEDYYWICKYLTTPIELDRYLKFREKFYNYHGTSVVGFPEQYFLSHFITTLDVSKVGDYRDNLSKLNIGNNDIFGVVSNFQNIMVDEEQKKSTKYYLLLAELAKLGRVDIEQFVLRYKSALEDVKKDKEDKMNLPYRFVATNRVGFVFIPVKEEGEMGCNNFLNVNVEYFKYKHRLEKCIGVLFYKVHDDVVINWTFFKREWKFNQTLNDLVNLETVNEMKIIKPKRY